MNLGCLVAIVFVHQLLSDATALPSVVKIGESILSTLLTIFVAFFLYKKPLKITSNSSLNLFIIFFIEELFV